MESTAGDVLRTFANIANLHTSASKISTELSALKDAPNALSDLANEVDNFKITIFTLETRFKDSKAQFSQLHIKIVNDVTAIAQGKLLDTQRWMNSSIKKPTFWTTAKYKFSNEEVNVYIKWVQDYNNILVLLTGSVIDPKVENIDTVLEQVRELVQKASPNSQIGVPSDSPTLGSFTNMGAHKSAPTIQIKHHQNARIPTAESNHKEHSKQDIQSRNTSGLEQEKASSCGQIGDTIGDALPPGYEDLPSSPQPSLQSRQSSPPQYEPRADGSFWALRGARKDPFDFQAPGDGSYGRWREWAYVQIPKLKEDSTLVWCSFSKSSSPLKNSKRNRSESTADIAELESQSPSSKESLRISLIERLDKNPALRQKITLMQLDPGKTSIERWRLCKEHTETCQFTISGVHLGILNEEASPVGANEVVWGDQRFTGVEKCTIYCHCPKVPSNEIRDMNGLYAALQRTLKSLKNKGKGPKGSQDLLTRDLLLNLSSPFPDGALQPFNAWR